MFDLVVRGGEVVTACGRRLADVGVSSGIVEAVEAGLPRGREEIDATGRMVLPGGVDGHCHVEQRSSTGLMTADDFRSASIAAACGGTTTIIPFAAQHRGQSLKAVVADAHARAEARSVVDYSFHLIVSDPSERTMTDELPHLIASGYTSFKIYMTYDALRLTDRQCLDVLTLAGHAGGLTMVHAENHDAVAWLTERLLGEGKSSPRYHADARPPVVEREAVQRIIALAELARAPLLIVHVSCAAVIDEIKRARARGHAVYAETCPQYLLLTGADLDRPGFEGAKFMFSPPPRERTDQDALWEALADGTVDIVASDHAPYRFDDAAGKKVHGENAAFNQVPSGVPGIELRLPLVFSEGLTKGRISPERFAALTAETPARLYGLFPQKGTIAVGSDADLVIFDPGLDRIVSVCDLHENMDYTPYEGMRLRGWPVATVSRGEIVFREGQVTASPGRGRFVRRRFERA